VRSDFAPIDRPGGAVRVLPLMSVLARLYATGTGCETASGRRAVPTTIGLLALAQSIGETLASRSIARRTRRCDSATRRALVARNDLLCCMARAAPRTPPPGLADRRGRPSLEPGRP
jgi:hypothetical protein